MASSEEETERDGGPSGAGHVGGLLQASRQRLGEELADVALMLRIRLPYLVAIEAGRYRELPGATYAVGFIRAYAEHLGLDSEEVVRRFKVETIDGGSDQKLSFPTPVPETGIPGGAYVFVGLVIAVIAYGAWYVSTTKDGFFAELISPLDEQLSSLLSSDDKDTASSDVSGPSSGATDENPTASNTEAPNSNEEGEPPASADDKSVDAATAPASTEDAAAPQSDETTRTPEPVAVAVASELDPAVADVEPETSEPDASPSTAPVEGPEPAETETTEAVSSNATNEANTGGAQTETASVSPSEPLVTDVPTPSVTDAESTAVETAVVAAVANDTRESEPAPEVVAEAEAPVEPVVVEPVAIAPTPVIDPAVSVETIELPAPPSAPASTEVDTPSELNNASDITSETEPAPLLSATGTESEIAVPELPVIPERPETTPETVEVATNDATVEAVSESATRIVINAKNNSWIQVRDDVANEMLVTRLLTAGDSYEVPNRPGLVLLTGNAGALEILVDGVAAPSIGGTGVVRRGVVLEAERLKQGTAVTN